MRETEPRKIYTIIQTYTNCDRGVFIGPTPLGSYLSLRKAREELARQAAEEKEALDASFDTEEADEDSWEAYEEGYAAGRFSRIEIVTSELFDLRDILTGKEHAAVTDRERLDSLGTNGVN